MRIRVWRSWVVRKIYWGRMGLVVLAALTCGFLVDGLAADKEEELSARVAQFEVLEADDAPTPTPAAVSYLVSSSEGVFLCTGEERSLLWGGSAYDTLSLPEGHLVISARYDDEVVFLDPRGMELLKIPADGPVDCEIDGRTLVVVQNGSGEVVGVDMDSGEVLWRVGGFNNHYDVALLPNGGMAVADSGNGRIVEFDADRKQVAEYTGLGFPSSVDVLPNGNLQVTTYHDGEVLELERGSGEVVRRLSIGGTIFRALRQDDGRTLVFEGERSDGESRLHLIDADGTVLDVGPVHGGVDLEVR